MAEANETAVGLDQTNDLYVVKPDDKRLCAETHDLYDKIAKQLYRLAEAWHDFKRRSKTIIDTRIDNENG